MILFCVNQTCHALSVEMAQRQRVQPPPVTGQARQPANGDTPAKYLCLRRV